MEDAERERIRGVATILFEAARPLRILSAIAWPPEVRERFLASGASSLPEVEYPPFDPEPTLELLSRARRSIYPGGYVDAWLEATASEIEAGARMIAGAGTPVFFEHSRSLYGAPREPLRYLETTPLALAEAVERAVGELSDMRIGVTAEPDHTAEDVAALITKGVDEHFGPDAPVVEIVDELSANALATSKHIRIRRGAMFTDRDARQLMNHEALVHVATALNGKKQTELPILGVGHPGTTRTQEGLAVLSEFMSGTMELDRFRRLADRTFAIDMAIEGADFIQVYEWFLDRLGDPEQAFESARRVFRGGTLTGGAPFTKDLVYVFGLLQANATIRAAFAIGRPDVLPVLFCGKLDIFALPALTYLTAEGMCVPPRYLPPWIEDPRFLLAFLTFATFETHLSLDRVEEAARRLMESTPMLTAT